MRVVVLRLLVSAARGRYEPALSHPDAMTLLDNSRDLPQRLRTIATNAAALARFLEMHPLVKRVHYTPTPLGYTGLKGLPGGGAIGLMSVVLTKDAAAPVFFDALNVRAVQMCCCNCCGASQVHCTHCC